MNRLTTLWLTLRTSLWFVPAAMVLAAVVLALVLVELEGLVADDLASRLPRLFGAGAEGSRGMLTAIATSMATVAGVVFSVTIVALSQASSQYSPRVLRHFMSDRPTQVVLGTFVAVFAYCLIVLRTIRGGDEDGFVPSLAVLGGIVMAFVGIGLLIYFIHHVASSIQVSSIIDRIQADTRDAIDRLFPAAIGDDAGGDTSPQALAAGLPSHWCSIVADRSGYVLAIEPDALLDAAERLDIVLRVVPRVGEFVAEGQPLLQLPAPALPAGLDEARLREAVALASERDVRQDAPFGLQQLVDVGLRALSPSLHDPTTAVACIDRVGALLLRLTARRIPSRWRARGGHLRLVIDGPGYAEMVEIGLGALTHHAGPHPEVHRRLVGVMEQLWRATSDPARREALGHRLRAHEQRLAAAGLPAADEAALRARLADVSNAGA